MMTLSKWPRSVCVRKRGQGVKDSLKFPVFKSPSAQNQSIKIKRGATRFPSSWRGGSTQLRAPRAVCALRLTRSSLSGGGCYTVLLGSRAGMMMVSGISHGRRVPLCALMRVLSAIGQGETLLSAHFASAGQ